MKTAGKVYRWIILSIVLQILVLTYVNNVYLNKNGKVKTTMVEIEEDKPKTSMDIKIPSGAENIKVSYNGEYASYILNGKMDIIEVKSRKIIKTISHDQLDFTICSWMPDRNIIVYSLKEADGKDKSGEVHLYTYDVEAELDRDLPKISGLSKGSAISGFELSPLTNVIYVKVKTGPNQCKLYKYNIMGNLSYVMNFNYDPVIKETNYSEKLLYEDERKRIFVRDAEKETVSQLQFKDKMVLLGVDSEDKVYAGELQSDGKIVNVLSGKLNEDVNKQWKKISLGSSVEPDKIIISPNGMVYRLAESENTVYSVENNGKITFKGKFVQVCDGFIASINKEKLEVDPIK